MSDEQDRATGEQDLAAAEKDPLPEESRRPGRRLEVERAAGRRLRRRVEVGLDLATFCEIQRRARLARLPMAGYMRRALMSPAGWQEPAPVLDAAGLGQLAALRAELEEMARLVDLGCVPPLAPQLDAALAVLEDIWRRLSALPPRAL